MTNKKTYQLLMAGGFRKFERVGEFVIERPSPGAFWPLSGKKPTTNFAFHRDSEGKGRWADNGEEFASQVVDYGRSRFILKPTSFGHLGLFAEQIENWGRIEAMVSEAANRVPEEIRILNLFAYTGGSTLAAVRGGAKVTHVDASKTTVDWAKQNYVENDLPEAKVKWIVDDCISYVKRELRRGQSYHGIILDPPSFGRGSKKQVWKIEDQLIPLLNHLVQLKGDPFLFVMLSAHSPGYTPVVLQNILLSIFGAGETKINEMLIEAESGPPMPSGATALWAPKT